MTTDNINPSTKDTNKDPSKPLTRERLYKIVWSEPMLKVAARYNVSSSYMARVCTKLNVPRPERGYWAKLAVGKVPPKPALPEPQPGDELYWPWYGQQVNTDRPLPQPPSKSSRKRKKPHIVPKGQHPLVTGAKVHFLSGYKTDEADHLKPYKKLLVDLVVSKTGLDRALSFANKLFLALEAKGYRVVIAPNSENLRRADVDEHEVPRKNRGYSNLWSPWRSTIVYIGTLAIGLTIIEMSERVEVRYINGKYVREDLISASQRRSYRYNHSWTTDKDYPTGRLYLQAYSPYWRAKWVKQWRETKADELDKKIKVIVKDIKKAAPKVAELVAEGERQAEIERRNWEAQQEQWRREEEERRIAKALKDNTGELFKIIERWAEANHIEKFFKDVEQRANIMGGEERLKILDRIERGRELIGSLDALDHFIKWKTPEER